MQEYDTVVLHTRPGSKIIWKDRAWFGASSEKMLGKVIKDFYKQWNFTVVGYETHNMCYAHVYTDKRGWPRK